MTNFNIYAFLGLIIRLISIAYIGFFIGSKQALELKRPKDGLTHLRRLLLATIAFSVISAIPSVTYQYTRLHQSAPNVLQNIASITGNLSYLGLAILFGMIYSYKKKD